MKKNTGLVAFKESEKKVRDLLGQEKISQYDVDRLTKEEKDIFDVVTAKKFNELKGYERDTFLEKMEPVTPGYVKNQLWENNHIKITSAISRLMQDYGAMPTKNDLAEQTGLSRQTISKHMKEYRAHPQYLLEMEQFKFMAPKVLAKVFKFAVNGDMRAAKLYFEMVGALGKQQPSTVIQEQNNYIQVNNTVLSQETIKLLNAEQLEKIEEMVKGVMGNTGGG